MPAITYLGKVYQCEKAESVLDCLARHGVSYPSSCRNGVCQTCLMYSTEGKPPADSQKGLKATLQVQNYFLACACKPDMDLVVSDPGEGATQQVMTEVISKEPLNNDIIRLRLTPQDKFNFRPGQFIHLKRDDGLVRSYSIASVPEKNEYIELHIRRLDNGKMTTWVHDSLDVKDKINISGPVGDCFYLPGKPEQNMLLIATGSGLAPLWGIVRDALNQGHTGLIHLFHGSYEVSGLYLMDELKQLAATHENFLYSPCVDQGATSDVTQGRIDQVVTETYPDLKNWRVYLCGHPDMVSGMKKKTFLAGASMQDIFSDSFIISETVAEPV